MRGNGYYTTLKPIQDWKFKKWYDINCSKWRSHGFFDLCPRGKMVYNNYTYSRYLSIDTVEVLDCGLIIGWGEKTTKGLIGSSVFDFSVYWKPPILLPKKTQKKSKINFPQFLRCMYVCVFVYVRSTGHTVWRMELKFLPRYLSIFIKRHSLSLWCNSEFWGSYASFSTF